MNCVRGLAIAAGMVADRIFGDPQCHHPVAYFGNWVTTVEHKLYRDSRSAGTALVAVTVLPPVAMSYLLYRRWPTASTAIALYFALGGRTLERTAIRMADELAMGDIEAARKWVPWLCSRDPQLLDEPGLARAAVESVAENTSDAAIAPLVWAAIVGAPGVVLHRCVNTLDAMVGYRNSRYENFGWCAAKLDDVLAYVPARITAGTHLLLAVARGRGQAAWRAWRRDASAHPSPNAGPVEATAAGALGVMLGGPTAYAHGVENRPRLGEGPAPNANTIRDGATLAWQTQLIVGAACAAACWR